MDKLVGQGRALFVFHHVLNLLCLKRWHFVSWCVNGGIATVNGC